ncbi:hypothetical protein ACHAXA_008438 [Cyclostephanos tholiformis]|uniref:PiggyBac transposable element-derived protein domain-containing protein n=1 Tax=Cyclostephanos tholiformis TaxID=382380 RepID=A0ABD3SBH9_9STRA
MSSEQYRWMLVDNFVDNINEYRARTFVPGGHLEADESIIHWYGVRGSFVDAGIPHYAAIERKPDNGAEIQNLADVASGIMLRLKIVKSAAEEEAIAAAAAADEDNDEEVAADEGGKGTQVLSELVAPWRDSGRLVTADAYFASVEAAVKMKEAGLHFIGNVKQCSRRFPMEVLGNATLPKRGCRSVLASINDDTGETELVAIAWVDRNRRLFIATTCGLGEGEKIQRKRLRQLDKSRRAPPDKVVIEVAQPKAIAKYYKGAGTIDRHNRIRADKLRLDRNLGTRHWDKRFNLGVLGIICVDAFLFFQQVVSANNRMTSCLEFFGRLADELVDNQEGIRITRAAADPGAVGNGAADAAEPTVRKTIKMKNKESTHRAQGRCGCKGCTRKSIFVCSVCTDATDPDQKQFWFCNPTTVEGSECFAEHVHVKHSKAHREGDN